MSQSTETKQSPGCSCQDATKAAQNIQHLVDLVKTANDATSAMAEALRVQGLVLLAVVERNNPKPPSATLALGSANTKPYGEISKVISERVGSVSVEQWEGMSEDSLRDLDLVLEKIINTTVFGETWMDTALGIHAELATVGLVFKTLDECLLSNEPRGWEAAGNTGLGKLVRMRALTNASCGDHKTDWWVDEMMRIVVRLMELRGM